jgi:hypothetical protein
MKRGLLGGNLRVVTKGRHHEEAGDNVARRIGSVRHRLDVHLLEESGATVAVIAVPPDVDGLRGLTRHVAAYGQPGGSGDLGR